MHYKEIVKLKERLRELKFKLSILKGEEPTSDNLKAVQEIEKEANSIENYIKMRARQYGFSA